MPHPKLSEDILLGSLTLLNPKAGDIDRCAIKMALLASGDVPAEPAYAYNAMIRADEQDDPEPELYSLAIRPQEQTPDRWWHALRHHEAMLCVYPWLETASENCPWCNQALQGTALVHHPFDEHVMTGHATMDALCSWIAVIESPSIALVRRNESLDIGLGVLFADVEEKRSVLQAAEAAGVKPGEYIAAAVRLVLLQNLSVQEHLQPEPETEPKTGGVNYAPYLMQAA
ncbi:MAG TPA: hypothetical protein VH079_04950 [Terriglobales bacterium]|nr:hypothetical protein [Terriglobales bacterium]